MRSGLVVTGVLGLGTGLVFVAAVVAATLFPSGRTIAGSSFGWAPDAVMLERGPAKFGGGVLIDGRDVAVFRDDTVQDGGIAMPEQGPTLPGPGAITRP